MKSMVPAREGASYEGRTYGSFSYQVTLPAGIDPDKVEAKLADGVLAVILPKSPEAKPKKIEVRTS